MRKGMLLVVSGPSGAGKGTLVDKLLKDDPSFGFSVSVTTRAPRDYEIPDVHYHFLSEEEYDKLLEEDAFLEHATVHGKRYGTLKSEVNERIARGQNVLLDIDVQGALDVMAKVPECVSVFILPPSLKVLRERLTGRGTETQEAIDRRMGNAVGEIKLWPRYRYAVVNDDLEAAYQQLKAVITAEKNNTLRFTPVVPEE
ncbi:MAG: guanylate kinase [Clostridia bacterium]|nr:guanylate kinase [Clostridia bacterium]